MGVRAAIIPQPHPQTRGDMVYGSHKEVFGLELHRLGSEICVSK